MSRWPDLLAVLLVLWLALPLPATAAGCPPAGHDAASLDALRASGFTVEDDAVRAALAVDLVDCLGVADPVLRDETAYAGLSAWMRQARLSPDTLRLLRERLYGMLDEPAGEGFARPFAALVLAELARTDRKQPWMDAGEREAMVDAATGYLVSVDDYRGFDATQGWRHGVAHGADWLMQLSLNPALDDAQLMRLVDAVAKQVVPESHAYVFGEPQRLAAPVLYAAGRGLMDEAAWTAWLAGLPPRLGDPSLAWKDRDWLYRRHDLLAFLQTVHVAASTSEAPAVKAMLPGVTQALAAVP